MNSETSGMHNVNSDEDVGTKNEARETILKELNSILGEKTGIKVDSLANFLDLGGNSIVAAQIINEINKKYSVELRISKLLDVSNISEFMDYVVEEVLGKGNFNNADRSTGDQDQIEVEKYKWPLTADQHLLWSLDQKMKGNPAFILSAARRIVGGFNIELMNRSYQLLLKKHALLRAFFVQEGKDVYQLSKDLEPETISAEDISEHEIDKRLETEASKGVNLAEGNLFRLRIFRINGNDHVLFVSVHQIIADTWSLNILLEDLLDIYSRLVQGQENIPVNLRNNFFDFIRYQDMMIERNQEKQARFWKENCENIPAIINLSHTGGKTRTTTCQAEQIRFEISQNLVQSVKKMTMEYKVTIFNFLYSAFAALLYIVSNQEEFLIAYPVDNRKLPEFKRMVGYFANTLIMKNRFSPDLDMLSLMKQNHDNSNSGFSHSDIPLLSMIQTITDTGVSDTGLPFHIIFNMLKAPANQVINGCSFQNLSVFSGYSAYDISLRMEVGNETIAGFLVFTKDILKGKTAQSIVSGYLSIIEEVAQNPNLKINELAARKPEYT